MKQFIERLTATDKVMGMINEIPNTIDVDKLNAMQSRMSRHNRDVKLTIAGSFAAGAAVGVAVGTGGASVLTSIGVGCLTQSAIGLGGMRILNEKLVKDMNGILNTNAITK